MYFIDNIVFEMLISSQREVYYLYVKKSVIICRYSLYNRF